MWDDEHGCVFFIDICARTVCAVTPSTAADAAADAADVVKRVMTLPNSPGCIFPSSKGGYLVAVAVHEYGSGGRLYRITPSAHGVEAVGNFEEDSSLCDILNANVHPKLADAPNQCLNDGACDAMGRVWVGSKILAPPAADAYVPVSTAGGAFKPSADSPPCGALFCCESAFALRGGRATAVGAAQKVDEVGGVHVSNGVGWSPDGAVMYYADSLRRCVLAYDFDVRTGMLRNERVFAAAGPRRRRDRDGDRDRDRDGGVISGDDDDDAAAGDLGVPDGLAVDVDGGVWVCLWDAGKVVRYLPAPQEKGGGGGGGGRSSVDRVLETPCSRPTSVCFGGAGSDFATTLFITSCSVDATVDRDAKNLGVSEPLAGAIFAVDVGVAGVPVHEASF